MPKPENSRTRIAATGLFLKIEREAIDLSFLSPTPPDALDVSQVITIQSPHNSVIRAGNISKILPAMGTVHPGLLQFGRRTTTGMVSSNIHANSVNER